MEVAIAVGRLTSMMFPIVMLIMNVSVVLATWFGGYRIGSGELQVGTLTAFQNYLVQILMSVMMATFMLMLWPRRRCPPSGSPRCSTPSRVWSAPDDAVPVTLDRGQIEIQAPRLPYPAPSRRAAQIDLVARPARRPRSSAPPAAASRRCSS